MSGSKIAAEIRAKANRLSSEHREQLTGIAMQLISQRSDIEFAEGELCCCSPSPSEEEENLDLELVG